MSVNLDTELLESAQKVAEELLTSGNDFGVVPPLAGDNGGISFQVFRSKKEGFMVLAKFDVQDNQFFLGLDTTKY